MQWEEFERSVKGIISYGRKEMILLFFTEGLIIGFLIAYLTWK